MNTAIPPVEPELWGIYHLDREYARELGDPLRTVVRAASKEQAEQEAVRLGFDSPWAHPVTPAEARHAQWRPGLQCVTDKHPERIAQQQRKRTTSVTSSPTVGCKIEDSPTPDELRVTMAVLHKLQRRIAGGPSETVVRQHNDSSGDRLAPSIDNHAVTCARNIAEIIAQLRRWSEAIGQGVQVKNRNGHSV